MWRWSETLRLHVTNLTGQDLYVITNDFERNNGDDGDDYNNNNSSKKTNIYTTAGYKQGSDWNSRSSLSSW
jgi:hypothetical protein